VEQSRELGPGVLFSFLSGNVGVLMADVAQILFITSLFAALLAFHNAVARYVFSLARENVLPRRLAYVNPRTHAPVAGSVVQSILAVSVVVAFAIAGLTSDLGQLFPVLTLFTWLSNVAALGLVLLMALVSLAVIGYFRRNHHGHTLWTRAIAPALSALALGLIFVLVLINFDVLIGTSGFSVLPWLLPAIALIPGAAGIFYGLHIQGNWPRCRRATGLRTVRSCGASRFSHLRRILTPGIGWFSTCRTARGEPPFRGQAQSGPEREASPTMGGLRL
jgi:amino acid transporter